MSGQDRARELLADLTARHGRQPRLGCELTAHRDLGFCSLCVSWRDRVLGHAVELEGWRLLAMAERGVPDQPGRRS